MKHLTEILYGCILGHFITRAREKLVKPATRNRFAIVADHCNWVDIKVFLGYCDTRDQMRMAYDLIDDSMFFMPSVYDLWDPGDRCDFNLGGFKGFDMLAADEQMDLMEAKRLCADGE